MAKSQRQILRTIAGLLALSFLVAGCESDGPEFAGGETTTYVEATLEVEDRSDTQFRALTSPGTVNLQLTELRVRDAESAELLEGYGLGVSIGLPSSADPTVCQVTFSKLLNEGESFSVYAREGLFCVVGFRPSDQPQETVVRYLLTLTGTFS